MVVLLASLEAHQFGREISFGVIRDVFQLEGSFLKSAVLLELDDQFWKLWEVSEILNGEKTC